MERYLTHRSHNSSVLCVDTNGRYLATGGADDRIVIIDLKTNKEIQVSAIQYFTPFECQLYFCCN